VVHIMTYGFVCFLLASYSMKITVNPHVSYSCEFVVRKKYPLFNYKLVWLDCLNDSLSILWNSMSPTSLLEIACSTEFNIAMASDVYMISVAW
jgi:hypothetical protein